MTPSARHALWVLFAACSDGGPGADSSLTVEPDVPAAVPDIVDTSAPDVQPTVIPNDPACPLVPPFLSGTFPWYCQTPGLSCTWPAAECQPGERPDNVCSCGPDQWKCPEHFHNCLALSEQWNPGSLERPAPEERTATACGSAPSKADSSPCSSTSVHDSCTTHAECEGEDLCLLSRYFGGDFACLCQPSGDCASDADCGNGRACACGSFGNCNGLHAKNPCGHRCVPAGCATSADCDPGGICSPSWDPGGVEATGFHCHDPAKDECLTAFECSPNHDCLFESGAWQCVELMSE